MLDSIKNNVERAIADLRRAEPVMIYDALGNYLLCAATELAVSSLLQSSLTEPCLLVTASRFEYITGQQRTHKKTCRLLTSDLNLGIGMRKYPLDDLVMAESRPLDEPAISLLKLAMLLPSACIADMQFSTEKEMAFFCDKNSYLSIKVSEISAYRCRYELYEVCRSPLALKNSETAEIIVLRPYNGTQEHYAIIIGKPDYSDPIVRIHSSCYTGDLLYSLSCDCSDQLHSAIKYMADAGGGVLVYLAQEGRGIGLVNKVRAYRQQICEGLDTVDANRIMGFEDDERDFTIAGKVLDLLKVKKFKLLTNNPDKAEKMRECGFQVSGTLELLVSYNKYNYGYMQTKFSRLGHKSSIGEEEGE